MSLWKFLRPFLILVVPCFIILRLTINFGWLSVQFIRTASQVYEPPGTAFVLVAGLTAEGKPNPTFEAYLAKARDWAKIDEKQHKIWLFGGWEHKGLPPAWQAGKQWLIEHGVAPRAIVTPDVFGERNVATTQAEVQLALRAIQSFRVRPLVITNPLQLERVKVMLLWGDCRPAEEPMSVSLIEQELGERFPSYKRYERLMWWYAVWDPKGTGFLAQLEKRRRTR